MPDISIIVPVMNEADNIIPLYAGINKHGLLNYELLFINDGSSDNTLEKINEIARTDAAVKCLSLSRNFGHQNALMAGMEHATGRIIIIMDGDLQHPPSLLPAMIEKIHQGFDMVFTRRRKTADSSLLKKVTARIFYSFINLISDTRIEVNSADFKAFNRKVLDAVLQLKERELFLRGLFSWVGFKTTCLEFDAPPRQFGKTKYSFAHMLRLALKGTTAFSFKPLRVALLTGTIISIAAFGFAVFALMAYVKGNTVPGWASLIIAIMFLGGTQLLAIGLLGEYIASLFTEVKRRPRYLIDKKINIG